VKFVVALALCGALAACQRTVFESAPAAADCDAALAGQWLSQGDADEVDGEVTLHIDASCNLRTLIREKGSERHARPTHVRTARLGKQSVLWVDADWLHQAFDIEPGPLDEPGDLYVYSYRINDGSLRLRGPDHQRLARAAIARRLEADVLQRGGDLTVRVRGDTDAIARIVRRGKLWQREPELRFIRVPDELVEKP